MVTTPFPIPERDFYGKKLVALSDCGARSKAGNTELSLGRTADFWDSMLQGRALSSLSPSQMGYGEEAPSKPPVQLLHRSETAGADG